MGPFVVYMLKSAIALTMLYCVFSILMSRETLHRVNRIALLLTLVVSLAIPSLQLSTSSPTPVNISIGQMEQMLVVENDKTANDGLWNQIGWADIIVAAYFAGLAVILIMTFIQIVSLARQLSKGRRTRDEHGNTIIVKEAGVSPFSFMNFIIVSEEDAFEKAVLIHEQEHIRLHHSLDILLLRIVQALQWFNPFVWLLGRDLQTIHEYEADNAVIERGVNIGEYQKLLIKKAVGNRLQSFANNLNQSSLKKRFTMMYSKKSSKWAMSKYLMILPVAAITVAAMARPELATKVESNINKIAEGKVSNFIPIKQEKEQKTSVVVVKKSMDNKKEPVIINLNKDKKEPSVITINDDMNKDIHLFVDGKEVSSELLNKIEPGKIDNISVIKNAESLKKLGINDGKGAIMIALKKEDGKMKVMNDDDALEVVEQMPQYPGGMKEMMNYLTTNVKYPKKAAEEKKEGRVIVKFVVEKDGSISNTEVVKSVSEEIDAEALRVVKSMPAWTPGKQKGKNVRVKFVLPVTFKLNNDKK